MKTFKGLALVGSVVVLALAAQGGAAGPTTVTSVYTVGVLTVPGVNTGLVLKKGHGVTVTATGTVCYYPGPPATLCVDPDGDPSRDTSTGGFVLPGAPAIGLIAKVGNGPWVHVGSGPTTLSGRGVLVFALNDKYWPDNTGSFTVTVSYACYPGWGYGDKNHKHCGPPGRDSESDACYPGYGHGDANHEHCGPPGLANKPPSPGHSSSDTHGSSGEQGNSGEHGNSSSNGNSNSNGGSKRP
ncbi:MAG TPA: hypothetical protein VHI12_06985 [Gaiellaceae bacterium]|jgi:hypothetical protein|nr:hypothetical protein [Gaiellaceae bacterium]